MFFSFFKKKKMNEDIISLYYKLWNLVTIDSALPISYVETEKYGGSFKYDCMTIAVNRKLFKNKNNLFVPDPLGAENILDEILTIAHEYGHAVSYSLLNEEDKKTHLFKIRTSNLGIMINDKLILYILQEEKDAWDFAYTILKSLDPKNITGWENKFLDAAHQGIGSHFVSLKVNADRALSQLHDSKKGD